jgi:hypothetical protein
MSVCVCVCGWVGRGVWWCFCAGKCILKLALRVFSLFATAEGSDRMVCWRHSHRFSLGGGGRSFKV